MIGTGTACYRAIILRRMNLPIAPPPSQSLSLGRTGVAVSGPRKQRGRAICSRIARERGGRKEPIQGACTYSAVSPGDASCFIAQLPNHQMN